MFTGIVQSIGVVRSIRRGPAGARLALAAPGLQRPVPVGASVCVNGVCLTAALSGGELLEFDVVPETLSRTTLGSLAGGSRVNLEPSLGAGDPMDGHVVQGHVDGRAAVRKIDAGAAGHVVWFAPDPGIMPFIIPKGSVAVDGVSLTIAGIQDEAFSIALIPTTLSATTLGELHTGSQVNIETDILARTVVTTLQRWRENTLVSGVTVELLQREGFV